MITARPNDAPYPSDFRGPQMRAAIYARYSSDLQRSASIEDQLRLCRERIAREGWKLVATYTDRAMSGADRLRPGYQKLMEDARAGEFDIVVAEALDRLSRDQEDVAALYKRLRFAGVMIVTLTEGEITDLHVGLKGTMNALYLKDLAAKTRRGLRGRIEAGRSAGGRCYGYDVVLERDAAGERVRGKRQINRQEAAIVHRIFDAYAAGKSPRRIAFDLNREGVPGPDGGAWGPTTINGNWARGTGILRNELYIGRLVWNRLRYVKDPETGKRVSRPNPPEQLIVQQVPELRILDQNLWDRVKARQASSHKNTRPDLKERPFWDRKRPRFLLSGLARCGVCGASFVKISANLFGCAAARNQGTCTNRLNIRRDALEVIVLDGLKSRLMDPELFKVFAQEFVAEVNRLRGNESAKAEQLKRDRNMVEKRIRRIVDAIAEGVPARSLKDELIAMEQRQDQLERDIARAPEAQPLLHPNLAELYRRKVAELHKALEHPIHAAEAVEKIRALIDAIVLTPEDGKLRVDLSGALAGILSVAQKDQRPHPEDEASAEQIKMVAGEGFEPSTFRL
jgi:site-specific DNA recombinase